MSASTLQTRRPPSARPPRRPAHGVWFGSEWIVPREESVLDLLPPDWVPSRPRPALRALPAHPPRPARTAPLWLRSLLGILSLGIVLFAVLATIGLMSTRSDRVAATVRALRPPSLAPARLTALRTDAAGGTLTRATFAAGALGGAPASFLVYRPPGIPAAERLPVLYLLHGSNSNAESFVGLGLPSMMEQLLSEGQIRPMLVVMLQGGPGENDWRNLPGHRWADLVLEAQAVADRTLPTIPDRAHRAIAGYSMGGFGATAIALAHPDRFSSFESWSGFFAGLGAELATSAPALAHLPLRAFLYGGTGDTVVDSSADASFATQLRGAGVQASSALYSGGHTAGFWHAHLARMLIFAARGFPS